MACASIVLCAITSYIGIVAVMRQTPKSDVGVEDVQNSNADNKITIFVSMKIETTQNLEHNVRTITDTASINEIFVKMQRIYTEAEVGTVEDWESDKRGEDIWEKGESNLEDDGVFLSEAVECKVLFTDSNGDMISFKLSWSERSMEKDGTSVFLNREQIERLEQIITME